MQLEFEQQIIHSIIFEKVLDNRRLVRYNGKAVSEMLL